MPSVHVTRWLLALADPTEAAGQGGPRDRLPRRPLGADEMGALCRFADAHGVLSIVAANLRRLEGGVEIPEWARDRLAGRTALSLAVRSQLGPISEAAARAGVPLAVLKGSDFADRLYNPPALRPFSDLDLIVPRAALGEAEALFGALGYARLSPGELKHGGDYGESSWRLNDSERASATVELHWDLVNSPALRTGLAVRYEDLQFTDGGPKKPGLNTLSPASLLVVAAVHAAAGHFFDRLCLLCDLVQCARGAAGPADEDWLAEAVRRTGCGRALAMGMRLTAKFFGEDACKDLPRRLGLPPPGVVSRLLLTRGVVLGVRTPLVRARRLAFRQGLKKRPDGTAAGGAAP